jgi:hypothetical protein
VIYVVCGHVAAELAHRDPSAIGVDAIPFPLIVVKATEHLEIGFPQQAKHI